METFRIAPFCRGSLVSGATMKLMFDWKQDPHRRFNPQTPPERFDRDGLLVAQGEPGICRVVCFSPKHNLTLANMDPGDIRKVIDVWVEQYGELGARPWINNVQIFENR